MEQDKKANGNSSVGAYAELRQLLIGPERESIATLQRHLEQPEVRAADVSEVLPAALRLRANRPGALPQAMHPMVEEAIRASIRRDPEILAKALFPLVGSAVRRAVSGALHNMMQTLNQVLEQSLSFRSLKWRAEAFRSGKSFAEIALVRSKLYRVERVFLIHEKTGLLLQQRAAESIAGRDPEIVSGMVTSIQDYVRDSFGAQPDRDLETLRLDHADVWIQHGPKALLASVIRGTPPRGLRSVFQSAIQEICSKKERELDRFAGDTGPFVSCQDQLRSLCFLGQGSPKPPRLAWLGWVAVCLALIAFAVGIYFGRASILRWESYMETLQRQPGIVVTSVRKQDGKHFIAGLRDPMAADPAALLEGTGVDPSSVRFHWELYHSLQPAFEAARQLNNEKLLIEARTILFPAGAAKLSTQEMGEIDLIARRGMASIETARKIEKSILLEVIGHGDTGGSGEQDRKLAIARAEGVRLALLGVGVPSGQLSARTSNESDGALPVSRFQDQSLHPGVTFRVLNIPK